jgi:hypothetical protein
MDKAQVFDLGELEVGPQLTRPSSATTASAVTTAHPRVHHVARVPKPRRSPIEYLLDSASLFAPGSGQILRGEWMVGLFYMASIGFVVTLSWALLNSIQRIDAMLPFLGFPREAGLWMLGGVYCMAAMLYLANVLSTDLTGTDARDAYPLHPAVVATASVVLPGWGQTLNGDRKRAALFLGTLWIVAASWLLVAPPVERLLVSLDVYLPFGARLFSSPGVRWTAPAVIWTLAVYDAASSAAARRR